MTGSIGVVVAQINTEKAEEARGIKVIEIVSRNAPNKRPDGTTDEGKQVLQDEVDAIERTFIGRVSESRNLSREYVEENFGRGGILVAHDTDKPSAISVSMIDGLTESSSIPNVIHPKNMTSLWMKNKDNVTRLTPQNADNFDIAKTKMLPKESKEDSEMTLAELMKEHPEINTEIDALKSESFNAGKKEAQDRISAATKYLESNEYPDEIKALACKALKGEQSLDTVQAAVAVADIFIEKKKSVQAADETDAIGGTPPQDTGNDAPSNDGVIRNEADRKAALARL
jgi:hypothetical protein